MSPASLRSFVSVTIVVISAVITLWMTPDASGVAQGEVGGRPPDAKCGLRSRLRDLGRSDLHSAPDQPPAPMVQPAFQAERTIGAFRFLYDTTGVNTPALLDAAGARIPGSAEAYVDSAGAIFNAVLAFQTSVLGYPSPIQPGQFTYDVTITGTYPYYGWTEPGTRIGSTTPARYTSSIFVDQDFGEFNTRGLDGLRVTAAHEFFHAVQFAAYGYWRGDEYFMELSSTWMEDVIYDDINDYYQYIRGPGGGGGYTPRGHFAHPDSSFVASDGLIEYGRAIFGMFLEKKYSPAIMRRAWERTSDGVALKALDLALGEYGSSFREAFLQWSVWNANTGPEADTAQFYPEGREYPRIATAPVIEFVPPSRVITGSIGLTSAFYYPVNLGTSAMSVIVANVSASSSKARASFTYEMAESGDGSYKSLSNGLFVRLDVPDPENWSTIESAPAVVTSVTTAPNPFPAREYSTLRFQIPGTTRPESVVLTVLSSSMERVFQGPLSIREDLSTPFVQLAEWNGRDRYGRTIGSGVYVYVLDVDGAEHTGKFAVIR